MSTSRQLQLGAAAWGIFSSAVFSVPIAVVVGLFDRDGTSGSGLVTVLKLVLLLVSAAFAGYAAGRTAGTGYAVNGALAGAGTFLVVQISYSLARGSWSGPLAFVYAVFLGACLGTLGGLFASRQTGSTRPTADDAIADDTADEEHDR